MKLLTSTLDNSRQNNILVAILATEAFLVLFQAYLVAPLIPALAESFHAPVTNLGLLIPAYTIPYGISTLFYGPLSDKIGRKPVLLTLFALLAFSSFLVPLCRTVPQLISVRIFAGLVTGGIVPISVSLIGDLYAYDKRGKPLGLLFGSMAGGMTFGATLGIFFHPILGWRNEFLIAALISLLALLIAGYHHHTFPSAGTSQQISAGKLANDALSLLKSPNGKRLYSYIFLNGMFHSGIFSWLGYFFKTRYDLSDQGIGLALLGYGVPGMLLGVTIGKLADRYGRQYIIPLGLTIGAIAVLTLMFPVSIWTAAIAAAFLSLGYDMTQPLFAGMVTSVGNDNTRGLAVGLSACLLFLGYGTGAYLFQLLMSNGLNVSFLVFAGFEFVIGIIALRIFRSYR